eukprot:1981368-Rhodomonas_salina.7
MAPGGGEPSALSLRREHPHGRDQAARSPPLPAYARPTRTDYPLVLVARYSSRVCCNELPDCISEEGTSSDAHCATSWPSKGHCELT